MNFVDRKVEKPNHFTIIDDEDLSGVYILPDEGDIVAAGTAFNAATLNAWSGELDEKIIGYDARLNTEFGLMEQKHTKFTNKVDNTLTTEIAKIDKVQTDFSNEVDARIDRFDNLVGNTEATRIIKSDSNETVCAFAVVDSTETTPRLLTPKDMAYDVIVRSQTEFNNLVSSSTWLNAKSVVFVGNGGSFKFVRANYGLKVPPTVKQISGINGAVIEVTNFLYNSNTNKAALWYESTPTESNYSIESLQVNCYNENFGNTYSFKSCTNLTNCTGITKSGGDGGNDVYSYAFSDCTNLNGCVARSSNHNPTGDRLFACGFRSCTYLSHCNAYAESGNHKTGDTYGFHGCAYINDCSAYAFNPYSGSGFGFYECNYISNSGGRGESKTSTGIGFEKCNFITNCTGGGNGNSPVRSTSSGAFGFNKCNKLSGCKGLGLSASPYSMGCGFVFCTQLSGCEADGRVMQGGQPHNQYSGYAYGYYECDQLSDCKGDARDDGRYAPQAFGFSNCKRLSNCYGLASCYTGIYGQFFGFYNCPYNVNCNGTWGGLNSPSLNQ